MFNTPEQFKNVYLHFPFCEAKCHYCDFFSLAENKTSSDQRQAIYLGIAHELQSQADHLSPKLNTVFIGGGTPSLVPLAALTKVLDLLIPRFTLSTEVTIEANPSSISREKADLWQRLGVNRVSMGVQALNDQRLSWLGRVHNVQEIYDALEQLSISGMPRINIDYILGVPDQSIETIEIELTDILRRFPNIQHVSAYLLTLKEGNPKYMLLSDEETQLAHLHTARKILAEHGFEHYEISNFARPGGRSLHNENYWLGGGYLGIGPSAHSFWPLKNSRTKNINQLEKYIELTARGAPPQEWTETLTTEQKRVEYLMLRLRRREGVSLEDYQALFGEDLTKTKGHQIDTAVQQGLCQIDNRNLQLTAQGMFLSDEIIRFFI